MCALYHCCRVAEMAVGYSQCCVCAKHTRCQEVQCGVTGCMHRCQIPGIFPSWHGVWSAWSRDGKQPDVGEVSMYWHTPATSYLPHQQACIRNQACFLIYARTLSLLWCLSCACSLLSSWQQRATDFFDTDAQLPFTCWPTPRGLHAVQACTPQFQPLKAASFVQPGHQCAPRNLHSSFYTHWYFMHPLVFSGCTSTSCISCVSCLATSTCFCVVMPPQASGTWLQ